MLNICLMSAKILVYVTISYAYISMETVSHLGIYPKCWTCTQVLAHTRVYIYMYDKNISSRTILVHWINLKMTFKSYWYINRICCSYNAKLPSFHEQHIEASHRVLVVSYNETNGIPPPFLIWTKKVVRDYFFSFDSTFIFFQMCMHIL